MLYCDERMQVIIPDRNLLLLQICLEVRVWSECVRCGIRRSDTAGGRQVLVLDQVYPLLPPPTCPTPDYSLDQAVIVPSLGLTGFQLSPSVLPIVCRNPAPFPLGSFQSFCETFPPKMSVGFIPNLSALPSRVIYSICGIFVALVQDSCYICKKLILRKIQKKPQYLNYK